MSVSVPLIFSALGQVFGPAQSGAIPWIEWLLLQVMAGNLVIFAVVGVGLGLIALALVLSWCLQSRCIVSESQVRSEFFLAGKRVAWRTIPLTSVEHIHAFLISSGGGYKISADLYESATAPQVQGWWPLSHLIKARRLAHDPREARRVLLLTALSDEQTADQVVVGMERLCQSSVR
ncbi:MAG TPA: hypothetical protein VHX44_13005 [Planctomycetota bacterium]|nr:hypothetical protein [Planctomycetota bacterium]